MQIIVVQIYDMEIFSDSFGTYMSVTDLFIINMHFKSNYFSKYISSNNYVLSVSNFVEYSLVLFLLKYIF